MGTTKSSEDYLEAILVIRRLRGSCRNVDIAGRLGRSKPSVTKALSNLAAAGLVWMSGRDVLLTKEGERARPRRSSGTASSSGCSSSPVWTRRPPRRRPAAWSTASPRTRSASSPTAWPQRPAPHRVARLPTAAFRAAPFAGRQEGPPSCGHGRASTGGGRGSAASRARRRCRERPWHRCQRCGSRRGVDPRRGRQHGRRRPRGHAARGLSYRPQGGPQHAQPRRDGCFRRGRGAGVRPGSQPSRQAQDGRARRGAVPAPGGPAPPPPHARGRPAPRQGDRPSRGVLRARREVQPRARTEADEGLVDRRGLKVAQARSAPARTGLSIPRSKMIRLGDHAAGKPPRVSVPRTPP